MNLNVHPVNEVFGIARAFIENVEDRTTVVLTKALGDVERCVSGYSKRHGFSEKLAGVFHRIWNAIKAIFGQSDWQKARRSLKEILITFPQSPLTPELIKSVVKFADPPIENIDAHMQTILAVLPKLFEKTSNKDLDKILNCLVAVDGIDGLRKIVANQGVQKLLNDKQKAVATLPALPELCSKLTTIQDPEQMLDLINALKELPAFAHLNESLEKFIAEMEALALNEEKDANEDIRADIPAVIARIPELAPFLQLNADGLSNSLIEAFKPLAHLDILADIQKMKDSPDSSDSMPVFEPDLYKINVNEYL